jgi:hypothetical protein
MEREGAVPAFNPWQYQRFALRQRVSDKTGRVDFTAKTDIRHHAAGLAVGIEFEQACRDALAQGFSLSGAQRISLRQDLLADFAFAGNGWRVMAMANK